MEYGDYGYKLTTNGRNLITACGAAEKALKLTRVAVGSGMVAEGVDLADVHELLEYVSDGEIGERAHEEDRLYLTVQYSNSLHTSVPTFYLDEFIVYAEDPETGEEVDLLYATLGNYKQPIPAYREGVPGSVFNFPLVIVVSDEINVEISASPGLVTYAELDEAVDAATRAAMEELQPGWSVCGSLQLTIPAAGWTPADPANQDYAFVCDVTAPGVTNGMTPIGAPLPGYFHIAADAGMMNGCAALTNVIRFFSQNIPAEDIVCKIDLLRMGGSGGGSGTVDPGVGLGFSMDGKLNVLLGNGLSADSENKINVDHTEVVTEDDMLDEDETEESVRNILLHGTSSGGEG